jgi:hypothetical protein
MSLTHLQIDGIFALYHEIRRSFAKTAGYQVMYLKCAHPECSSDFDYGQGRLFRFQKIPQQEKQPTHWHAVKHYWLCSRCCESFTIEYEKGLGVLLLQRLETIFSGQPCYFVLHAEVSAKPALSRRAGRSRIRRRRVGVELQPVTVGAIEILETRNLERSRSLK